ncbi:MAG: succinylglutamate desuccinylase [Eggerthellaceae bacterium]|nr:succinylglutamate desuccinylase [Eggerthellaceae bacterium]
MIETVFSVELPVREHLRVQKNRIIGAELAKAAAADPTVLERAPRLAVVTGIHGDELEGQYVAYQLSRILNAHLEDLHGIVDIYPAINPLGINAVERGVPGFDLDLNRIFPGDAEGPLTEALAAAVIDDIEGAVACVDIHASNIFLREMPQVRINENSAEELLPLAPLLNVDFVWVHASATVLQSTLAYSLNARNTPTLVVETGVGMRITPEEDEKLAQGLLRLAAHFGIWSGRFETHGMPVISGDKAVSFLNAEAAGIFLAKARHGLRIGEGELIGQIVDPLQGTVMQEVICPASGLLFTLREYPVVYPGSLLARVLKE